MTASGLNRSGNPLLNVRCWSKTGKHLLRLSLTTVPIRISYFRTLHAESKFLRSEAALTFSHGQDPELPSRALYGCKMAFAADRCPALSHFSECSYRFNHTLAFAAHRGGECIFDLGQESQEHGGENCSWRLRLLPRGPSLRSPVERAKANENASRSGAAILSSHAAL